MESSRRSTGKFGGADVDFGESLILQQQAVDRAYRIGQTRDVIVYRFIMASAIEEKMYEKQVFKV